MIHKLYAEEKELLLKLKGKSTNTFDAELDLFPLIEGTESAEMMPELENLKENDRKYFLY